MLDQMNGFISECKTKKMYSVVTERILSHSDTLVRIGVLYRNNKNVLNSFLSFVIELSYNNNQRLGKYIDSSNGLIVFRFVYAAIIEISKSLLSVASSLASSSTNPRGAAAALTELTGGADALTSEAAASAAAAAEALRSSKFSAHNIIYEKLIKPTGNIMNIIINILTGGYIPFSICVFYKDFSMGKLVNAGFSLFFAISKEDFLVYKMRDRIDREGEKIFRERKRI